MSSRNIYLGVVYVVIMRTPGVKTSGEEAIVIFRCEGDRSDVGWGYGGNNKKRLRKTNRKWMPSGWVGKEGGIVSHLRLWFSNLDAHENHREGIFFKNTEAWIYFMRWFHQHMGKVIFKKHPKWFYCAAIVVNQWFNAFREVYLAFTEFFPSWKSQLHSFFLWMP